MAFEVKNLTREELKQKLYQIPDTITAKEVPEDELRFSLTFFYDQDGVHITVGLQ